MFLELSAKTHERFGVNSHQRPGYDSWASIMEELEIPIFAEPRIELNLNAVSESMLIHFYDVRLTPARKSKIQEPGHDQQRCLHADTP